MGRGVSAGGGQSSLGYLFGSGEAHNNRGASQKGPSNELPSKPSASQAVDSNQNTPAGALGNTTNNYRRADGQNCRNVITITYNSWNNSVTCTPGQWPTVIVVNLLYGMYSGKGEFFWEEKTTLFEGHVIIVPAAAK